MKESRPVSTVETLHTGFHVSGWKSDIERQRRVSGRKRPDGVTIVIDGGFSGYSGGNLIRPQNQPPAYGVSGGPCSR